VGAQLSLSKTYRNSFSGLDTARAALYLKSLNLADLNRTLSHVTQACAKAQCFAAGEGVVYAEYSNRVVGTLVKSFVSSLVLVGAIVLFLAQALGTGTKKELLFSVFWSPVLIVGGLALFRVPLNLTTSMFASVLVGLTGDNAVQYLFASRGGPLQEGIHRRGGASVQVTAIAASASLLFLGLTLVPLKTLGLLLFLGFVISLAGDLWVLSGLITRPRS
jgi:predicted RND superfamily exporter protein